MVLPPASPTQIAPTISFGTHHSGLGDSGVKIYVGNLSFETREEEVNELFSQHGEVNDVSLITDRETGRPRGFGFVEMRNDQSARDAIAALDGVELGGRNLKVNEAKARPERGGRQQRRW
ncbi:MAG: RNA-binding protein [Planctomycetes bacterium]|nr:RNA-binding protein [Planctomycetota bacterium]NOG53481.1 RNA-binding protein [Planctomycetota bacterium]